MNLTPEEESLIIALDELSGMPNTNAKEIARAYPALRATIARLQGAAPMTYEVLVSYEVDYLIAAGWTNANERDAWREPTDHGTVYRHGHAVNLQKKRDREARAVRT